MDFLRKLSNQRWFLVRAWFWVRDLMRLPAYTRDPQSGRYYRFRCDSFEAYQRARRFLGKEPETIRWITSNLKPDDVFLDVGANIGIFSLYTGARVSSDGHVYACEPHLPTATQLLRNIASNGLEGRVSVLSIAVSGEDGFTPFRMRRWREGASGSQLDTVGKPHMGRPVATEMKCSMTIDSMIHNGVIPPPNMIKIDTDGIELPIAKGMKKLLTSPNPPRSVLIEVQKGEFRDHVAYFKSCGYELRDTHVVGRWKTLQNNGVGLDELAFNALFEPVSNLMPAASTELKP